MIGEFWSRSATSAKTALSMRVEAVERMKKTVITTRVKRITNLEVDRTTDALAGSAPAEVLPELDWCKSNASKSLNTRSGPDAVHSEPASSVIGPG